MQGLRDLHAKLKYRRSCVSSSLANRSSQNWNDTDLALGRCEWEEVHDWGLYE